MTNFSKALVVFISISFHFLSGEAYARQLSDEAEIYLITCGPGPDLYSAFGHTAIWVLDRKSRFDYVYNYGVFDFNTPNFYTKFIRGRLKYRVSRNSYKQFLYTYQYEKRSVFRQKLNLSHIEKQKLFDSLEINFLPENRYYLYDYLYNNCSSKIIDIIEASSSHTDRFSNLNNITDTSFRQNLDKYLRYSKWLDFGIDLALGLPADKYMTVRDGMFLPDNLMNTINLGGTNITGPAELMYKGTSHRIDRGFFTPFNLLLIVSILFLVITLLYPGRKISLVIDGVIFGLSAFLGIILLGLWFGTDHESMEMNLNILWALPFNILYFFRAYFRKRRFYRIYWIVYFILIFGILISWAIFPQELHIALIPFLILLLIRVWMNK